MKQFSRILCLALVLVTALSTTALAAAPSLGAPEIDPNRETREVTVKATVSDPVEGQQVTILVIPSNVDLGSVSDSDVAYVDQAATTEGKAEFKFIIPEAKGDSFVVYVGGTNVASAKSSNLYIGERKLLGDICGKTIYDEVPNNKVDITDYNKLVSVFGSSASDGEGKYIVAADICGKTIYDEVPNNKIDISDYNLLVRNFGKTLADLENE